MSIDTSTLENEIVTDLTAELNKQPTFDAQSLASKVKNAVREVMQRRNYGATSYKEQQILDDLQQFYSVIRNLALYDFSQIGAPFEESHSENSTNRSWVKRESLLGSVCAFVEVL